MNKSSLEDIISEFSSNSLVASVSKCSAYLAVYGLYICTVLNQKF